jgi:hypothetical protein
MAMHALMDAFVSLRFIQRLKVEGGPILPRLDYCTMTHNVPSISSTLSYVHVVSTLDI